MKSKKKGRAKSRALTPKNKLVKQKRNKHIYTIDFGKNKTANQIDNAISLEVDPLKELPKFKGQERNFVKLTAISENRKKKSAVTYIYEVNEPFDINLAMLEILYETYNAPKHGQKGYLKRVRAGNITQFIVDFETSV